MQFCQDIDILCRYGAGSFEIVFVSSDRTEDQMEEYMKEAHGDWVALEFGDMFAADLSKKYGVTGKGEGCQLVYCQAYATSTDALLHRDPEPGGDPRRRCRTGWQWKIGSYEGRRRICRMAEAVERCVEAWLTVFIHGLGILPSPMWAHAIVSIVLKCSLSSLYVGE